MLIKLISKTANSSLFHLVVHNGTYNGYTSVTKGLHKIQKKCVRVRELRHEEHFSEKSTGKCSKQVIKFLLKTV